MEPLAPVTARVMLRDELGDVSDTLMIIADGYIRMSMRVFCGFHNNFFPILGVEIKEISMKKNGSGKRAGFEIVKSRAAGVLLCVGLLLGGVRGYASVALLMGEPYGTLGGMSPTGHAAIYLNRVCAETPTRLRMCHPGELGVVVSRYSGIAGYDWIAIPVVPYLYAVDELSEAPQSVDANNVSALRDAYRREHLMMLAPDDKDQKTPGGGWIELVGASYDRTIHVFEAQTTVEQDERFVVFYNDKRNVSHFNFFLNNCADFSKNVLNFYFPHAVHKNYISDVGLTTPKQAARSFTKYGKKHPEMKLAAYVIPQVPGSLKRSTRVNGVVEALVKSKRYLVPLAILHPEFTGGLIVVYLSNGRFDPPKNVPPFQIVAAADVVVKDETTGNLAEAGRVGGFDELFPKMTDGSPTQVIGLEEIPAGNSTSETLPVQSSSLTALSEMR